MLRKKDILEILGEMELPLEEYWIVAGAALVVHGIKEETADIDLGCTTYLADLFVNRGCKYIVLEDKTRIVEVNDKVELLENWFVEKKEYLEGFPIGSIESIKKHKISLGRKKDFEDIRLIDEFIKIKCTE